MIKNSRVHPIMGAVVKIDAFGGTVKNRRTPEALSSFGSAGSYGVTLPGRGRNLSVPAESLRLFQEGSMSTP
jgi:hypothetical protein